VSNEVIKQALEFLLERDKLHFTCGLVGRDG
jgi:Mn-containing catalase